MTTGQTTLEDTRFEVRGVDHIAIGTDDMAEALRFYVRVLGFKLVMARRTHPAADAKNPLVADDDPNKDAAPLRRPPGAPQFDDIRHYSLDMGNDSILSIFEYPKGTPHAIRDSVAGLQHIAFHTDRPEFEKARRRLDAFGIEYLGPIYLGDGHTSINLFDPAGVRLELVTEGDAVSYSSVGRSESADVEQMRTELRTLFDDEAEAEEMLGATR